MPENGKTNVECVTLFSSVKRLIHWKVLNGPLRSLTILSLLLLFNIEIYVYISRGQIEVVKTWAECMCSDCGQWMVLRRRPLRCLVVSGSRRSRNVETCGPRDSLRWQKTVGMLLLVPLSTYTSTSLQLQKPSFCSSNPQNIFSAADHIAHGELLRLCECVYDLQL